MKTLSPLVCFLLVSPLLFAPISNSSADAAVRKADQDFAKAFAAKSLEQILASYAPDAVTAGSAMFHARAPADFRAHWRELLSQPNFTLAWTIEKIVVTESGLTAYSAGTWSERSSHGPYLLVWQKQNSHEWKVLIDAAWEAP
jgi:ketosteroid isomerase-like protein